MKRVLIAGHLEPFLPPPLGFSATVPVLEEKDYTVPLRQFSRGFLGAAPRWEAQVVPFGPGRIFEEELRELNAVALPTVPNSEAPQIPTEGPVLVEMGHDVGHDWGKRLWDSQDPEHLRTRDVVLAYSTSRSLYGAGGTSNTAPDLTLRLDITEPAGWRETLSTLQQGRGPSLALGGSNASEDAVGSRPGSGAGGGAAAWLMALGARAHPTGEVLAHYLHLEDKLAGADLVIVASPHWHSPDLADAVPLHIAEMSARLATPTVGIGFASSLSAHEQAQWGLHGIHLLGCDQDYESLGRRVGQTWGRS